MSGTVETTQTDSTTALPVYQKSTTAAAWVQVMNATPINVAFTNAIPANSTALNSASGNVAAVPAVATLAAAGGKTTYISGFEVTGAGATAGSIVLVTITGLLGGTATYNLAVATGATVGNAPLIVEFAPSLPASAINTAIVVTVPSLGAGNTNSAVVAHGLQI